MSDSVVGRGIIELVADARQLKAGIEDAKKSIRTLGDGQKDISATASQSIDKYIGRLQAQNETLGKSTRETEIYKLALRGASDEQLKSADAILKLGENHKATASIVSALNTGLIAAATAGAAAAAGLAALVMHSINAAAHLQDLNRSTGISVENLAGLSLLAKESGTDIDSLAKMVNKMSVEMGKAPDKFIALGITAKDGVGALKQFADIFQQLPDLQQRNALAQAIFKKSWDELAPLLSLGSEKIGEIVAKGTALSGVTTDLARDSKLFKEQLDELELVAAKFGVTLAGQMLKGLTDVTKAMNEAYAESGKLSAAWVGLGGVGAFLWSRDEFASASVKLKNLNLDLQGLQAQRALFEEKSGNAIGVVGRWLLGDPDKFLAQIASTKAQIANLEKSITPKAAEVKPPADPKIAAAAAAFLKPDKTGAVAPTLDTAYTNLIKSIQEKIALDALELEVGDKLTEGQKLAAKVMVDLRDGTLRLTEAQKIKVAADLEVLITSNKTLQASKDRAKAEADADAEFVKAMKEFDAWTAHNAQVLANRTLAETDYLSILLESNRVKLAGMSIGDQEEARLAARLQIYRHYTEEVKALDRSRGVGPDAQALYDEQLAIIKKFQADALAEYDKGFADRLKAQGDWTAGATKALQNYYDESRNIAKQTEDLFTHAFKSMEDALVNFVMTGKIDFKSLANSIIADLVRIQIKASITGPLAKAAEGEGGFMGMIAKFLGGSGASNTAYGSTSYADAFAGGAIPMAGGGDFLVTKPTLFLAGEAGPERATFGGANSANSGPVFNVDMRGASVDAVARLERLVASVNGSIETRALNVVRQASLRGA
jgi:lambda family phage tail tape measure protein